MAALHQVVAASTVTALQAPLKQESGGLVKTETWALAIGQTHDLFRQQSRRTCLHAGGAARQ